ncbi:hypothetical protein [Virgibacillus xinjiangensis]|uniref:hypothetical protein n=1 Tax=Virgibacillus xinjiangensis TaxID=393090 RepID=UPI0036F27739
MKSAGGARNRRESWHIGRKCAESAGEPEYQQEVRGIGGRAGISAGGARNWRESWHISRKCAESAVNLLY